MLALLLLVAMAPSQPAMLRDDVVDVVDVARGAAAHVRGAAAHRAAPPQPRLSVTVEYDA